MEVIASLPLPGWQRTLNYAWLTRLSFPFVLTRRAGRTLLHHQPTPMDGYDDSSKLLDDIFADVDANENPAVVAGSCDEESDLDEPKELPPTPAPAAAIPAAVHARVAPGISRTPLRRPLGPAATTRSPGLLRTPVNVQRPAAPMSNGGGGESEYWMVQW